MRIKKHQRRSSLLIIAAALLLAVGVFFYIRGIQRSLLNQAVSELIEVTSQGSHAFEVYIEKDMQLLKRIVRHLRLIGPGDTGDIDRILDTFKDDDVDFSVADLGQGYLYGSDADTPLLLDAAALSAYAAYPDRTIRDPYQDEFTGHEVIGGCQHFQFADGTEGLVQVKRDLDAVSEEFMLSFYNDMGFSYIVNRQGKVLLRPSHRNSNNSFANLLDILSESGNSRDDVQHFRTRLERDEEGAMRLDFDGEDTILAFAPISGAEGWYLIAIVPDSVIMKHADEILNSSQIFLVLVCCIFLAAGLFLYFQQRTHKEIREKEGDILYREELFNLLANNTNDVFLMFSTSDYSVEYISPNVERVLGISPEEARANLFGLRRPDDTLSVMSLKPGESVVYEGERIHRKSGEPRWFVETVYRTSLSDSERFVAVLSDRTHERRSEQTLKDALAIAKTANESKSLFLSNMSHDIRTPMNAIIGFSTLLQRDAGNPERVQEYTRKIASSSQHLLSLINDVLDMSKIESGKTTLNISEISLAEIVDELATMMQPQARARQQDFRIYVYDVCNEEVLGDRLRINQILINILSNSIKYTPEGGRVEMSVRQLPQNTRHYARFHIVIQDNGIGMTPEYLETIFQPFTRETNARTLGIQGTGLGMAITRNLIDLMGGTIAVESELGKGSTFTLDLELRIKEQDVDPEFWNRHGVTNLLVVDDEEEICTGIQNAMAGTGVNIRYALGGIPAVQMAEEAQRSGDGFDLVLLDWQMPDINGLETAQRIRRIVPSHVPIMILTSYDINRIEGDGIAAGIDGFLQKPFFISNFRMLLGRLREDEATRKEPELSEEDLTGMRILAAEDNELNSEILLELLEMTGASCDIASNGQEALDRFTQSAPGTYDIILMDVQMPVMNGYEATRAIRDSSHPEAETIPIIAMTANAFSEDVREALDAGMNAHVAKPIDMDRLRAVIQQLGGSQKA